ncbi:MAG: hypothetical protein ACLFQX_07620 [Candidatus Kapaibacterium sp.]
MLILTIIYLLSFGVYLWLWYLLLFKKQRMAHGISQFIVKIGLTIPLWALFIFFAAMRLVPPAYEMVYPPAGPQAFIIKNNTDESRCLVMLRRTDVMYRWLPAIPFDNRLSPLVPLDPGESAHKSYTTENTNKFYLQLCEATGNTAGRYARAFDVEHSTQVVYVSELFRRPLKTIRAELINQYHDIALFFVAIVGIIYHLLTRRKTIQLILTGAAAAVVLAVSGYIIYISVRTILYLF